MINKTRTEKAVVEVVKTQPRLHDGLPEQQESNSEETFGQRLADSMTAKIGSWAFLTVQSSVLAVWITLNSVPGVPHWDNNPFILLNLVFSFASAYTAPVVLMSQNRQSERDRKIAEADSRVNVKAGQDVELLHTKIDALYQQLITEQQQKVSLQAEQKTELLHTPINTLRGQLTGEQQQQLKKIQGSLLPSFNIQQNTKFPEEFSDSQLANVSRSMEDNNQIVKSNTEFVNNLFRRIQ